MELKVNIILLILAGFGLLFVRCEKEPSEDLAPLTFDSVNVGFYVDDAVWPNCSSHTESMLKRLKLPYARINRDSILRGDLTRYSVLLLTAGRTDLYYENIGSKGCTRIRNYVQRGGGYIGICGTAYLAAEASIWHGWAGEPRVNYTNRYGLAVFNGAAEGPVVDFAPDYEDFNCRIRICNNQHIVVSGIADTITYLYNHGGSFIPSDTLSSKVIGRSLIGNHSMLLVTTFHNGRVFLSTGHPELSSDPSCIKLMENALLWCSGQID